MQKAEAPKKPSYLSFLSAWHPCPSIGIRAGTNRKLQNHSSTGQGETVALKSAVLAKYTLFFSASSDPYVDLERTWQEEYVVGVDTVQISQTSLCRR